MIKGECLPYAPAVLGRKTEKTQSLNHKKTGNPLASSTSCAG